MSLFCQAIHSASTSSRHGNKITNHLIGGRLVIKQITHKRHSGDDNGRLGSRLSCLSRSLRPWFYDTMSHISPLPVPCLQPLFPAFWRNSIIQGCFSHRVGTIGFGWSNQWLRLGFLISLLSVFNASIRDLWRLGYEIVNIERDICSVLHRLWLSFWSMWWSAFSARDLVH